MIRLLSGDCRDVLATLPAESVHTVVTSPPYFGLRDYGTALWDGGDAGCDHKQSNYDRGERANRSNVMERTTPYRDTCGKCGATRVDRQIGLEATPDAYLATMVGVFREIRRVLRPDGTCWVNMGDSYNANQGAGFDTNKDGGVRKALAATSRANTGLAPKQLLLMPARLALALQADGWWIRSDIIWHKPNPMPESCTDRPTSAHEHVFLLTKAPRYYFDNDAIREAHIDPARGSNGVTDGYGGQRRRPDDDLAIGWKIDERARSYNPAGRSCRNVWTIATQAYPDAHFATFPAALAERCIRAGTSERGCCAQCGAPWVRVVERSGEWRAQHEREAKHNGEIYRTNPGGGIAGVNTSRMSTTTGWSPSCTCHGASVVPATILDPFIGAGTTALVADRLQRDCIGIDLNVSYTEMAMARCRADAPLFADLGPVPEPPEEQRQADMWRALAAD